MLMHYTNVISANRYMDVTALEEYRAASPFKRLRMFAAKMFDLSCNPTVMKEKDAIITANNHEVFKNFIDGKPIVMPVKEVILETKEEVVETPVVKLADIERTFSEAFAEKGATGVKVAIVNGDHIFTKDNSEKTNICNLMINEEKYQEKKAVYEEGIAELLTAVKEGLTYDKLIPIGSKFRGLNRTVIKNDKMNKEVKTEMFYELVDALQETKAEFNPIIDAAIRIIVEKVLRDASNMKATSISKALYTTYMVATIYQCAKTMSNEKGEH